MIWHLRMKYNFCELFISKNPFGCGKKWRPNSKYTSAHIPLNIFTCFIEMISTKLSSLGAVYKTLNWYIHIKAPGNWQVPEVDWKDQMSGRYGWSHSLEPRILLHLRCLCVLLKYSLSFSVIFIYLNYFALLMIQWLLALQLQNWVIASQGCSPPIFPALKISKWGLP